ncbi:hypothetical protein L2755_21600 [Shewanella abyssi]|uniref:hypothetical protein n=1 Tax=Shewanella abyssi TaxID=311789 RepID=UPI00200C8B85|nr:hypothetical protein [Shewanella abyssi]MCL1052194.1 hypothetical protein [Shewanella abyssi]
MKLSLKKNKLKNLTKDNAILPNDATAQIAGAGRAAPDTDTIPNSERCCGVTQAQYSCAQQQDPKARDGGAAGLGLCAY